jgi:alkanesulfonate monooxygenase SsuD/methylene tetrahydromethanopterin reductase-like flavin-dependent oxidoreductase (luciferase family)
MRLSTLILPCDRWATVGPRWRRAEELGFHAAYTYDHLTWGRLQDAPWFGAVPTLAGAALSTSTMRLGTMVTSPNFRHPIPLAKDLMTIDDLSGGRLSIGVGSGGVGRDSLVLGDPTWSARERADRFEEFVELLDRLFRNAETSSTGEFYRAHEARMIPGTVQSPRPPLYVAADGARGMDLAARIGDGWITLGRSIRDDVPMREAVAEQLQRLAVALDRHGVSSAAFSRLLLLGFGDPPPFASAEVLPSLIEQYSGMGIDEIVVHWPVPDSPFEADIDLFEESVSESLRLCHNT